MPNPESSNSRGSLLALVLVLLLAACVTAALVFLTFGYFMLVLLIGAGVFGLAGFHYLVWGWWLTKAIQEEERQQQERNDDDA